MSLQQQHFSRFLVMTWFCLAGASAASLAQEDTVPEEPTLTVRISPPNPYLQEQIVQVIRVIAPHPFEELVLDLPPVEGAEIITLQQPKNRKFETYGGEGYIYETSRALFPKRSGELRIPPIRISGSVGISRNEKKPFTLREDAVTLDVSPPPLAFSDDWWLVARDVSIDESWSQPLETLRVGDRVTRSIAVAVSGATGAHLPELEQGRSNGLTVLPGRIERVTETTQSGVIGTIRRSFDIRVDVDQPINISPVRIVWWNTNTESEQRSAAPAVRLEPLPRDVEGLISDLMAEAADTRRSSQRGILIIALSVAALLTALAFWLLKARLRVSPEDRMLKQALAEDQSPISTIRALSHWAETSFPGDAPVTLEQVGLMLGPNAEQYIARLQHAAFGQSSEPIDTARLALDVMALRQAMQHQSPVGMLKGLIDRLLGPEKRLPKIDKHLLKEAHPPLKPLA